MISRPLGHRNYKGAFKVLIFDLRHHREQIISHFHPLFVCNPEKGQVLNQVLGWVK
jgi:hypothetical protein